VCGRLSCSTEAFGLASGRVAAGPATAGHLHADVALIGDTKDV